MANRRLFTVVREERRLTYDASFNLKGTELRAGGWWLVAVTSSPAQVEEALEACRDSLRSLLGPAGVSSDSVQSAKRTLASRFRAESGTNKFWIEHLSGTQLDEMPLKSAQGIAEYEDVLAGVTADDVGLLVELLSLGDASTMTACIGVTAPQPPSP